LQPFQAGDNRHPPKTHGAAPKFVFAQYQGCGPGGPGGRCVTVTVTVTTNVTVLLMNVLLVCSLW